jgi:hypothetical protein
MPDHIAIAVTLSAHLPESEAERIAQATELFMADLVFDYNRLHPADHDLEVESSYHVSVRSS